MYFRYRPDDPIIAEYSFPYRERHLQCLWADHRHRPGNLTTTNAEPVEVEHAGEWNLEAGPDFLNAVLLIGKERRRISGDLEIHIHPQAWNRHGHTEDPRYRNVRFHIVYFKGVEVPGLIQIPLEQVLSADPFFSLDVIDTVAYPYSIPSGHFPLRHLPPDRKIRLLQRAGTDRLRIKTERLAAAMRLRDPDQVLWEEIMTALGYKNNKRPFRRLAAQLSLIRLHSIAQSPAEIYALLLGLSGLLPLKPASVWPADTRRFIRTLWDHWWKQPEELKEGALSRSDWNLTGLRPVNHPVRRLMAAAYYAFRIPALTKSRGLLTDFPDNFWNTHLSWTSPCKPTSLIGQSRANAIITNIIIPFRAATGACDIHLEHLPAEPMNGIIRQTAFTLFGPDHTPRIYQSALARQGLIHIFHEYLISHRLDELQALAE